MDTASINDLETLGNDCTESLICYPESSTNVLNIREGIVHTKRGGGGTI